MVTTDNLISDIEQYLQKNLTEKRLIHSVSTAETSKKLCEKFNLDSEKGYIAGLLHDVARELPEGEMRNLALSDRRGTIKEEEDNFVLLHGRAGAVTAKKIFSVNDESITEAIRLHTTGDSGMCELSKIVFIADYIEPKRKYMTQSFIDSLEGKSLDSMLLTVIYATVDYLREKSRQVSVKTLNLVKELECEK